MNIALLILFAVLAYGVLHFFGRRGHRAIRRGLQKIGAIDAVTSAFREGEYEAGLQKTEDLRTGLSKSAEYCFFRGSMLYHLGRFEEAEASLREGLSLEEHPKQKALVYNTLASVFLEQGRYAEAIAFFEIAGRAWPDRGANHRGIAQVWLRQGREFSEAVEHARQAVEIDRSATGLNREALNSRLGEDLAVLAWAVAANSGSVEEVESILAETFLLLDPRTKPTLAEAHYHAARALDALNMPDESRGHFQKATELDPRGTWGRHAKAIVQSR